MNAREYYEVAYEGDTRSSRKDVLLTSSLVMAFLAAAVILVILTNPVSPLAMVSLNQPRPVPAIVRVERAQPPVAPEPAVEPEQSGQTAIFTTGGVVSGVSVTPAAIPVSDDDDDDDKPDKPRTRAVLPEIPRNASRNILDASEDSGHGSGSQRTKK